MHNSTERYANTGSLDGEGPIQQQQQEAGVTPWQFCTVLVTLRDVQAGEELTEDYSEYDPPCRFRGDCAEFLARHMPLPAADDSRDHQDWTRAVLVQSPDVYTANGSSPGGGLGVFAAQDLPAGTVWNKEDAAHALAVTREQWAHLLRLHVAPEASGVSKPLFRLTVDALRSFGSCCLLDDRVYLPFTTALLAKRRQSQAGRRRAEGSSTNSTGKHQLHANAVHVRDAASVGAGADVAVPLGSSLEARCTWLKLWQMYARGMSWLWRTASVLRVTGLA
ncbi:hypothetical protein COO60DRAFT_705304 [Scenedesmus sp. NREL 46B-D3]|nr:hypothetical protein COO60DRAFT_705304 [Scenedesmus sp. NREL 46B-D3]